MKTSRHILSLILVSLLPPVLLTADEEPPARTFLDRVEVNLINLEVVVSRDGMPAHGLTAEDFTILDDGQPVEISNFYAVEQSFRRQIGGQGEPKEIEPFDLVVLVDDRFLANRSRAYLLELMTEQIDPLLAAGGRVLVARQNHGVVVEQPLTTDREALTSTLERLAKAPGSLGLGRAEEFSILAQIRNGPSPSTNSLFGSGGVDPAEKVAAQTWSQTLSHLTEVNSEVSRSIRALEGFLGSMAGLPRRKAMLYLCDRLPVRPGNRLVEEWWNKYGQAYGQDNNVQSANEVLQRFDLSLELARLAASASTARVALYPIGDQRTSTDGSNLAISGASNLKRSNFGELATDAAGLGLLADTSGGRRSRGLRLGDELVTRLRQDLSSYYSLAFHSPHGGDDGNHRIEVKLRDPELRAHHLAAYRDKNAEQQMHDRTLAALYFTATEDQLGARAELGTPEQIEKDRYKVPVTIRWPMANLVLVPESDAHVGQITVFIRVRDEDGGLSEPATFKVPIEIPNPQLISAMSADATYKTGLVMRGGAQVLAIGVRDDIGADSSSLRLEVQVGKEPTPKRKRRQ